MFKKIAITLSTILLLVGCSNSIEPPKQFMESKIIIPLGMNSFPVGEFSVSEFKKKLSGKQLDNGKYPEIIGWTKNDNVYALEIKIKDNPFKFIFTHLLSTDQGSGKYSTMYGESDGKEISGVEIMKFVMM